MFLIFDVENQIDPIVCRTADAVREAISDLDGQPFQVLTIDLDELCCDVTGDFVAGDDDGEEYPDHDAACSRADARYQAEREAAI